MRYLALGPNISQEKPLSSYYISKFNTNPNPNIFFYKRSSTPLGGNCQFKIISINDSNNVEKIIKDFVSCSGLEVDEKRIIIMPMTSVHDLIDIIFHFMTIQNGVIDTLFDSKFNGILNLSEFNKRFNFHRLNNTYQSFPNFHQKFHQPSLNLNDRGVLSFILFLCALYCLNVGKDVHIIEFKNNDLTSLDAFIPAKKIFPSLETIIVEGNEITRSSIAIEEIRSSGVVVQQYTGGFTKKLNFTSFEKAEPQIEFSPPEVAVTKAEETIIEIKPMDFIANPFLISFLQQSLEDMRYISKYYEMSAIMTITAETSTDLMDYQPFTRSLMHGKDNFVQGPAKINEFCLALFGQSVLFNITKMQSCEVVQCGYLIVLHGFFVDRRQIKVGFDRSLLIGQNNGVFFITNDQIHFRSIFK